MGNWFSWRLKWREHVYVVSFWLGKCFSGCSWKSKRVSLIFSLLRLLKLMSVYMNGLCGGRCWEKAFILGLFGRGSVLVTVAGNTSMFLKYFHCYGC